MQPNVIQKRPEKAILLLLNIMLLTIVQSSSAIGSFTSCDTKIVTKVKIYNELAKAYLKIKNGHVLATDTDEGSLYKISKGGSFYLYDPDARKYICWKKRNLMGLVAKDYRNVTDTCKFREIVARYDKSTHVELVAAIRNTSKMMFRKNGKFLKTKCSTNTQHHKRHGKCRQDMENKAAAFLNKGSCISSWFEVCSHGLETTQELRNICRRETGSTIFNNNV